MIARYWRPVTIVVVWLLAAVYSLLVSPPPQAPVELSSSAADGLLGTLGLSADPALLVFHRAGGLTPDDRSCIDSTVTGIAGGSPALLYGAPNGETQVMPVSARPADVPSLRSLLQSAPCGLETHVTGGPAFAQDAVIAWEWSRPLLLPAIMAVAGLVALLSRLGPGRALVVAVSAGLAGAVTISLAALVASAAPVALATVLSAALAGSWAARLLVAAPLETRTPFVPRPPAEGEDEIETGRPLASARPVTPLQRVLILAGEVTLLQAFLVLVGLAGLLFDYRAGGALLIALLVAVATSLIASPALAALLAEPHLAQANKVLRPWLRVVLLLALLAGLYWLIPLAQPSDWVPFRSDAATGYRLLSTTGDESVTPGRLLPLHLLLQAPVGALDQAGEGTLRGLASALEQEPALSSVDGLEAVQPSDPVPVFSTTLAVTLTQLRQDMQAFQLALADQAGLLSGAVTDVQGLAFSPETAPIVEALTTAKTHLTNVQESLASAGNDLSLLPSAFPEVYSRVDHVPVLRAMPATFEAALLDLDGAAGALQQAVTQTEQLAGQVADPASVVRVRSQIADSAEAMEALSSIVTTMQGDLDLLETALAQLETASPSPPSSFRSSGNLVRLVLIPAGDPYAPAVLDQVPVLQADVARQLQGGPLAGSLASWAGAPVDAAARRAYALQGLLLPGLLVTLAALALVTWSTLSRPWPALLVPLGALLSAAAGIGAAAALWHGIDANVLALVAVGLVAFCGGRLIVGRAPVVEDLLLALIPLALLVTGTPALMAIGLATGAGLLACSFFVVPTLFRRPRLTPPGE